MSSALTTALEKMETYAKQGATHENQTLIALQVSAIAAAKQADAIAQQTEIAASQLKELKAISHLLGQLASKPPTPQR